MRIHGMQECVPREAIDAISSGSGIARIGTAVATDRIICPVAKKRVVDSELRVVEDVKRLDAQLEILAFLNLDVFKKSHVEIPAAWIIQSVAAGVAERQPSRGDEGSGI